MDMTAAAHRQWRAGLRGGEITVAVYALSAGGSAALPMLASSSMSWNRRCTIGVQCIAAGSSITAIKQYVSIKYTERQVEAGIEPLVGSVGDGYDCEFMELPEKSDPSLRLTLCHRVDLSALRAAPAGPRIVASLELGGAHPVTVLSTRWIVRPAKPGLEMIVMSDTIPTDVIIGVDTHKNIHAAAAISALGVHLASTTIPASSKGYQALETWATSLGTVRSIGIEGTGSYGAGLSRFLTERGHAVVEVNRANRQLRHQR